MLNLPAIVSLVVCVSSLTFGLMSLRIGHSLGRERERYQALLSFSALLFAAWEVPLTLPVSTGLLLTGMRLQLVGAAIHGAAWLGYVHAKSPHPVPRLDRGLAITSIALAVLCFIPGLSYTGEVSSREVAWLGVTYNDPVPTAFNELTFAFLVGLIALVGVRVAARWRAGDREAPWELAAIAGLTLTGALDSLTVAGILEAPYVLSLGFLNSVVISWVLVTERFIEQARAEARFSQDLERQVEARTRELLEANAQLARAERLASFGQMTAGVAHEINNPATIIVANLDFLAEELQADRDALDLPELRDAVVSTARASERIRLIVQDLLAAGRAAGGRPADLEPVPLAEVAALAVEDLAMTREELAHVTLDIPPQVEVLAHREMLTQVLMNGLTNAADAAPSAAEGGHITLRYADGDDGSHTLHIEDNGEGMPKEQLRRAYDPFFTTKPVGEGTGLGLPVSLGLMSTMRGALALSSTPGEGTQLTLSFASDHDITPKE